MAFAQALLERVVQFIAGQSLFPEIEVMLHHRLVDLDDLVDDLLVPLGNRAEIALAFRVAEAVYDPRAMIRRQVQGQALGTESLAQFLQSAGVVGTVVVDLVDDDDPAQVAGPGVLHHPSRAVGHAAVGIDDHGHGLDRGQRGQRGAAEVGIARCVDQVEVDAFAGGGGVVDAGDGGIERVAALFFDGVEIGDGAAAFDAACRLDRAAGLQQGFEKRGFAGGGVACEGHVADGCGAVGHERTSPG